MTDRKQNKRTMRIGDKVKLNSLYWDEGKAYFGKRLKSFKNAIVVRLIDIPNGQIAVLDNEKQINTKFLFS